MVLKLGSFVIKSLRGKAPLTLRIQEYKNTELKNVEILSRCIGTRNDGRVWLAFALYFTQFSNNTSILVYYIIS